MKTNLLDKYLLSKNRESAKEQGFYDGRFRNKVVPNKKKQLEKKRIKQLQTKENEF